MRRTLFVGALAIAALGSRLPASAADVARFEVAGIRLGMPLDAAEAIVEKRAVAFDAPGVHGTAARGLKYAFYDCATHKSFGESGGLFVIGGVSSGRPRTLTDYTPQTVPAGVCVDAAQATTATGKLSVTFLPTVPGDASSQVVARVHLTDAVPAGRRIAHESIAVHYYETQMIARYGQPTFRDPYKAHRAVATSSEAQSYAVVGPLAVPLGTLASVMCNASACTEHQGRLTWCSGVVSSRVCAERSVIPDDSREVDYHYPVAHTATEPEPTATFDYHVAHSQAELARIRADGERRSIGELQNKMATSEDALPYELLKRPAVAQRLLLRFDPESGRADVVLENEALFAERFPIANAAPPPIATPAF